MRARRTASTLAGCLLVAGIAAAQDIPSPHTNPDSRPTAGGGAATPFSILALVLNNQPGDTASAPGYRSPLKWLAAANSEKNASSAVEKSAAQLAESTLKESFFSKFDRTEFSMQAGDGKPVFSVLTVQPVHESKDLVDTFFFQGSLFGYDGRTTVNLGLGYRKLMLDEKLLAGVNAFFDHEFPDDHERSSLGLELRTSVAELNVNRYFAITDWRDDRGGGQARTLPGVDAELGVTLPYLPYMKLYAKTFKWYSYDHVPDVEGSTYSLGGYVLPGLQIETGRTNYSTAGKTDENFFRITYIFNLEKTRKERFAKPFISKTAYSLDSMKSHRFDKVRRENRIYKQKRFIVSASGF